MASRAEKLADELTGRGEGASPPRRRGGRPKLYNTPEEKAEARREREREKRGEKSKAESVPVTESDVQAYAFLGGMLWKLVGPMVKLRPLTDDEAHDLGVALAPVAAKYMSALGGYESEIALLVCVGGLYFKTKIPEIEIEEHGS